MMTNELTLAPPSFVVGRVSDAGRSGKNNEDSADTFQARLLTQQNGTSVEAPLHVAVVADGIGGNVAGEMASRTAVDTIKAFFGSKEHMAVPDRLTGAIIEANRQIYDRAAADPTLLGMGTTVVAAVIAEGRLYVAHAGDSRAYLLRNGQLYRLTLDHTWAQEAIEANRLTPAQAKDHPNRHVIKRFLGISETVDVDSIMIDVNHGGLDPEQIHTWPKTNTLPLQPGDSVMLCSDGLTDVVDDERIAATVNRYAPQEAAQRLVDQANKAGGPDNITVVVVKWPDGTPAMAVRANKRSPLIAAILGLALVVVAGAVGYLLAGNREDVPPAATAIARTTADNLDSAGAITTTLVAEAPTAEPTLPPTEPAPAEPTATPLPTATETATPAPTATVAPPTSTPVPSGAQSTADTVEAEVSAIADNGAAGITTALEEPTGTPVAETAAQNSGTVGATSTPIPDFSPTATVTATPTPSRTPTAPALATRTVGPTGTATARSVASSTNNADFAGAAVTLVEPSDGDTLDARRQFAWTTEFKPNSSYAFEVVFWQAGQDAIRDGRGVAGSTQFTLINIEPDQFQSLGMPQGEYQWAVYLITVDPFARVNRLSESRRIVISYQSNSSDNNGNCKEGLDC
jgi:serine/threonine protein phosphatase PrpC